MRTILCRVLALTGLMVVTYSTALAQSGSSVTLEVGYEKGKQDAVMAVPYGTWKAEAGLTPTYVKVELGHKNVLGIFTVDQTSSKMVVWMDDSGLKKWNRQPGQKVAGTTWSVAAGSKEFGMKAYLCYTKDGKEEVIATSDVKYFTPATSPCGLPEAPEE